MVSYYSRVDKARADFPSSSFERPSTCSCGTGSPKLSVDFCTTNRMPENAATTLLLYDPARPRASPLDRAWLTAIFGNLFLGLCTRPTHE